MKQIDVQLPTVRTLSPYVAYATGLICENRPDLADGVRAAVLGDDVSIALHQLALTCGAVGDGQGNAACYCLRLFVEQPEPTHADRSYLHALADILNIIPRRTTEMRITTGDGEERVGDPTIGDVWCAADEHLIVCGLGGSWLTGCHSPMPNLEQFRAHCGALVLQGYLRDGWEWVWGDAELDSEREALRRLIPLHAHTVSLDADARAAWAKAHLDALT